MNESAGEPGTISGRRPLAWQPADRLRQLLEQGDPPDLHLFLNSVGPLSADDLAAVLRVDQRWNWEAGNLVLAEAYFRDHAILRDDPNAAIDLIYNEYLLRERRGERADPVEFCSRFPEYAAVLMPQIELHAAMAAEGGLDVSASRTPEVRENVWHLRGCDQPPVIPGYEVLCELGRGGMGVVYKARHVKLKRIVALKMLLAGAHAGEAERQRFRTEAEAVGCLQHPHIVQIHEVGEADGRPFLSLEYLDGGNLKSYLQGTPLPALASARLVATLARAVHYAHERGIVHRDLKPANVLLSMASPPSNGRDRASPRQTSTMPWPQHAVFKVADFGLAKQLARDVEGGNGDGMTQSNNLLGTPSYMAPEQAAGKHKKIGPAADTYALGAILYELLTGRPPFQGETPLDTLQQVIVDEPVSPRRLGKRIPLDLDTICLKCLEKDPSRRYATAAALADDLERFADGMLVMARPVGTLERTWRWSWRNPRGAAMIGAVASLLMLITVGALLWSLDRSAALRQAQQAEAAALRKVYESRVSEARARSMSRRPGQRFASLRLLDEATRQARQLDYSSGDFDELRNATIAALVVPDLYPTFTRCPGDGILDFDDELAIYAYCDRAGNASIRRVDTDAELCALPGAGLVPTLSRDARFVAVRDANNRVTVWRIDQTPARSLLTLDRVSAVDFHANGINMALAQTNGAITILDLERAQVVQTLPPQLITYEPAIALHPIEPVIAVASYHSPIVQIRNVRTGMVERSLDVPEACSYLAWHPSGQWLLASSANGPDILVFDRATFRCERRMGTVCGGAYPHFNHAGDRFAVSDWNGAVKLFDFVTGQPLVELPSVRVMHLRFARDDRRLAGFYQDGQFGTWEVGGGGEYRTLTTNNSARKLSIVSAVVSPDGRLLAIAFADAITFWDLATATGLASLPVADAHGLFFESSGALVTSDRTGTYRWPVHADGMGSGRWHVGPPQPLALPPGGGVAASRDGRIFACRSRSANWEEPFAGAWVLDLDRPDAPRQLDAGVDIGQVAVSPDGRWVVTKQFGRSKVKVWDAHTGRLETERDVAASVQFTPDGWLALGQEQTRFYSLPDWREQKQRAGGIWFSPDGALLAVTTGDHVLTLIDAATDRELARLEDPNLHSVEFVTFTPDASKLITVNATNQHVHVWDLRALRHELAERGLDWHAAPLRAADAVAPIQLDVDMGDYRARSQQVLTRNYDRAVEAAPHLPGRRFARSTFHLAAGRYEDALSDLQAAVKLAPNYGAACNALSWLLATGPAKLRDPQQAVVLAERAVKVGVGHQDYLNTLGVAYYRAGRTADAITVLEQSLSVGAGQADAFDLYFLALCQHQLGNQAKARDCFDRATAWHAERKSRLSTHGSAELDRFRVEAEEALGLRADTVPLHN